MTDPTTREVLEFLKQTLHLHTRQAQHALTAGLAGPATADGRARRYDVDRVIALSNCTQLTDDEVWDACPRSLFIGRIGRHRGFHVGQSWEEQARVVCDGWYVPLLAHLWLMATVDDDGTNRFIATLADVVVFGATILRPEGHGPQFRAQNRAGQLTRFVLARPGPWYDSLAGRRLSLGPGYPWKLWGAPVSAAFDRTGLVDDAAVRAAEARIARRRGRPRPPTSATPGVPDVGRAESACRRP